MKIITFFLFFFPLLSIGQIVHEGVVINKQTKENIQFATVRKVLENIGTSANENGKFSFMSKSLPNDTLIISSVGYVTTKFPVSQLPENLIFELNPYYSSLNNVLVRNDYKNTPTINQFSNCGFDTYTTNGWIKQIAQLFQVQENNCLLSEINICTGGGKSIFRLKIYDKDTLSGKPSRDLLDTVLEINTSKRNIDFNLEKYNIIIPGKSFFVVIEWLFISENSYNEKTKMNGTIISFKKYRPNISIKSNKNNSSFIETWILGKDGRWLPALENKVFLISAKVKY
jgi:hypothetical protein